MAKANIPGVGGAPTPDDATLLAQATECRLPSGHMIWWLPPDEMEMLVFTGVLPDPITSAVYVALRAEGAIDDKDDGKEFQRERTQLLAEYHVVKHGMVKPRFDPDLVIGDGTEVWGRRNLLRQDRQYMFHWLFRLGTTLETVQNPRADEPERTTSAPSDSEGVRADPSATDGDNG